MVDTINEQAEQLKVLKRKRGILKGSVTKFQNYLNTLGDTVDIAGIKTWISRVEPSYDKFMDLHVEIECIENKEDEDAREDFDNQYFVAMSKANAMIETQNKACGNNSVLPQGTQTQQASQVVLPTMELPTFAGEYDKWLHFKETFISLVETRQDITEVQKFFYLSSCLKAPASAIVESLERSSSNYSVAWKLLEDRYENTRLIVQTHVAALFDLPSTTRDNAVSLRKLTDEFNKHMGALKQLKQPTEHWGTLLIHLLCSKLDNSTRRMWESTWTAPELPELSDLVNFLVNKCRVLESVTKPTPTNVRSTHVASAQIKCAFCSGDHYIYKCSKFANLAVEKRISEVKRLGLCINCLKKNHYARDCKSSRCKQCDKSHNSLLHLNSRVRDTGRESVDSARYAEERSTNFSTKGTRTLLPTAFVKITSNGESFEARALLDSGSDSNFVTSDFLAKFKTKNIKEVKICINGLGHTTNNIRKEIDLGVGSRFSSYKRNFSFLVMEKITSRIPVVELDVDFQVPQHLKLADDRFNTPGNIDILLGAEAFFDAILGEKFPLGKHKPALINSHFGWLVTGNANEAKKYNGRICNMALSESDVQKQLELFWKLENVQNDIRTEEEKECELDFVNTAKLENGRFTVNLPIRPGTTLGDSRQMAMKRFFHLEKRFKTDLALKKEYCTFMKEYLDMNHMEFIKQIKSINDADIGPEIYYIPDHAIVKSSSSTTKLRVVFDASAKSSNGLSLNDTLRVGSCMQDELFTILLRFRTYRVVLVGDVAKMYRQVLVNERSRDFQRIFWRNNESEDIGIYRLRTLTYGTGPASFLATRCLRQSALEYENLFPKAAEVIQMSFYMDDLICGADSAEEVVGLKDEIVHILKQTGFELRKFVSNNEEVLRNCGNPSVDKHVLRHESENKTLRVIWDPQRDILRYEVNTYQGEITKRGLLSAISQIFDPMGLIAPITVSAKILLQKLWQKNLDWDDQLPDDLKEQWTLIMAGIRKIPEIKVPRHVLSGKCSAIELHGFCDASETAYGCAVYIRHIGLDGDIWVSLLCAKSKIAPIKKVSLPRLELCGAVLLVRLMKRVIGDLKLKFTETRYWTDSTIVMGWLNRCPSVWKTFVANRVAIIQELSTSEQWSHVEGINNPADLLTRGAAVSQLNNFWYHGPDWLSEPNLNYTRNKVETKLEIKQCLLAEIGANHENEIFHRVSSLPKLISICAWVFRFVNNSKKMKISNTCLTRDELHCANITLLKLVQRESFVNETTRLKAGRTVRDNSNLIRLNPFLDKDGVIRVGGRVVHANINYNAKHPIILPKKHKYTELLIRHEHVRLLHAGPQQVLASLREKYWVLGGRDIVRRLLRKCVICFKSRPIALDPIMGNLPKSRVTPVRPFYHVCVDYGGPFMLKDGKLRNRAFVKGYICIFVCSTTKAIHIEVASDLTTHAFLLALKRFISRRGIPRTIYSDNGTNFVGSYNYFKELKIHLENVKNNDEFSAFVASNLIEWHFMPANSPHMGGLHEAAIRSAKVHLNKIIGDARLTYEQFYTIMCQIEAVLNSRPLTPLSDNPNDYTALTAGHCLIGEQLVALPEAEVPEIPVNRLREYERIQLLVQHFWNRWRREVLSASQQRTKWTKNKSAILQVGKLVILKDDNVPVSRWKMARVSKLHPGSDGVTRVVSLTTPQGETTRAVRRVCPFPDD